MSRMSALRLPELWAGGRPLDQAGTATPRELEIALNGPVGPQRLRADTQVFEGAGWYRTLTPSASWPGANEVLFSRLDPLCPDTQIDAVVADYHRLGLPLTWCVYPWSQPADLGARLLARGASVVSIEALLGSTALPLDIAEDVSVARIDASDAAAFDVFMDLMAGGYQLPPDEAQFRHCRYRQLASGDRPCLQLFVARYQDQPAGCAAMVLKPDSAHFTGDYVVKAYQARGVFQSLLAARMEALRRLGIAHATGHSNQQSAFWAKRFGFRPIYSYSIYQLDPPAAQA